MILLEWFLPILIGASLGIIGGGGTVLAVPVLLYVFSLPAKTAIGMSLGIVSIVSLVGSYSHWKQGNVKLENAAFFTPFAMLGAFIGAKIANLPWLTSEIQLALFSITVMISSVLLILRKTPDEPTSSGSSTSIETNDGRKFIEIKSIFHLGVQGFLIGILTGVVGVGGGFLIVPSLVLVAKVPIRTAIGTSLVVIFFNSFAGFLGYLGRVEMDFGLMAQFLGLAILGVLIGSKVGQFVPKQWLTKGFGIFLFGIGIWILAKEFYLSTPS